MYERRAAIILTGWPRSRHPPRRLRLPISPSPRCPTTAGHDTTRPHTAPASATARKARSPLPSPTSSPPPATAAPGPPKRPLPTQPLNPTAKAGPSPASSPPPPQAPSLSNTQAGHRARSPTTVDPAAHGMPPSPSTLKPPTPRTFLLPPRSPSTPPPLLFRTRSSPLRAQRAHLSTRPTRATSRCSLPGREVLSSLRAPTRSSTRMATFLLVQPVLRAHPLSNRSQNGLSILPQAHHTVATALNAVCAP